MVLIGLTLGLLVLLFLIMVALTRAFERNRVADIIDWKPTRSPELEAQNDIDDIEQMIEAQNQIRRRRGLPDRDEAEIEESVRRHREELADQARRYRTEDG